MSDSDQVNGNKFVRIDQDSDTELQALFDSVLKPNGKKPLSVPYSMRKLPKSFFNPPSTGSKSPSVSSISHSRENSADSAFGNCITTTSGLHINHSRAHSSPASLQQTYSQQPTTHQHQHLKQRSYDITTVDEHDLGPLPPGWEQAKTEEGQIYFLNHNEKTTTWEDPRKVNHCRNSITAAISSTSPVNDLHSLAQQGGVNSGGGSLVSSSTASSGTGSSGTLSPVGSELAVGPLPEGWEQAQTKDEEVYFINHLTRTTSWFDPRIPAHLQRAPPSSLSPQTLNSWIQHQQPPVSLSPAQVIRMESLKAERERLKMRQREIQQHDVMSRTRTADPFLSAAGVLATAPVEHTTHTRQESADSGLGMGNNYSLPHTPEDFLNSIDDNMDGVNEDTSAMSILDPQEISSLTDHIDSTEDLIEPPLRLEEYEILNDVINNASMRSADALTRTWL